MSNSRSVCSAGTTERRVRYSSATTGLSTGRSSATPATPRTRKSSSKKLSFALSARARVSTLRDDSKPWIFTIAVNLARDRAKRRAHHATPELRAAEDLPEPPQPSAEDRWARRVDIERAMEKLPENHREVLELRYFEGLEEPEIAAAANIPRGTVKSRLHHAVRKMRDLMTSGETP